jgi:DMSO reductase anchor subunit
MNEEMPLSPLARSAFLMRFRLGLLVRSRLACGVLGGIILPLLSLLPTEAGTPIAVMGLCLCLAGELAERALFFLSVATVKMPGGVAA